MHECCRLPVLFELLQTLPQAEPLLYLRAQDLNLVGALHHTTRRTGTVVAGCVSDD